MSRGVEVSANPGEVVVAIGDPDTHCQVRLTAKETHTLIIELARALADAEAPPVNVPAGTTSRVVRLDHRGGG